MLVEGIGTFAVEIQELGVFKLAQTMLHKTKEKALQSARKHAAARASALADDIALRDAAE